MGDYAAALPLLERAAAIGRLKVGEAHPVYAESLSGLATVHREMGDYAAALPLLQRATEIYRAALGEAHPAYAQSLHNLARVLTATGRATEALTLFQRAAAIDDRMIGQAFSVASERQRFAFLQTLPIRFDLFLSLVLEYLSGFPAAIHAALDLVLRRKAIAAEATATQRDAVLGGKYPALRPRLQALGALRMQVARAALAGPGPESPEVHLRRLAEWSAQRDGLEAELARQVPEMNLMRQLRAADRRAVALALPEGVALAEFVQFRVADSRAVPARGDEQWKPARYVAFVLRAGDPDDVRMIDLGEAESIDFMIIDFLAGVTGTDAERSRRDMSKRREGPSPASGEQLGSQLRAVVFDRLLPALDGHTRLLIAPDGGLSKLPFQVLPRDDGRRLIDDYQISYLGSGRDVLRFGVAVTGEPGGSLVVADPDFDLEAEERLAPDLEFATPSVGRHSRDLDHDRGAYHFHRLPGTRAEGERVATRLGVPPWFDATALEGRLKTACHSPRILHLATHGFFLPDQERDLNREDRGHSFAFGEFSGVNDGVTRLSGPMMENPMLRSGLALAGANIWLRGGNPPEEAEDGLLTAEDVSGLDLLATELVVLSACETGLGQVRVGEGVFGLRRAFILAGAKTLVMSLWKVPDEPTRELMENFYCHLLAGQGRAEALRQAQLAMKAKHPEPFYWGAFICQGDPSPLGTVRPGIADTGVATG
jgi:CHAT domain-containing protein/tetratricopeptide (TPR) repeat protein